MSKKKKGMANVSGKPKHSLDTNRKNGASSKKRSAAIVRRLKMYSNKPVRNHKGKILKHDFQSQLLPNTRIQPDLRWFQNSRVIDQKKLELFREEMDSRLSSNYNVISNERKLPLSLLNGHQKNRPSQTHDSNVPQSHPRKKSFKTKSSLDLK